ncbi:MAG: calcium-binding protein [Rhizobiales bacterium]|nr:calcium-binding protein [Hyphomicrobiales bacterium]
MALPVVQHLFGWPTYDSEEIFFDSIEDGSFITPTSTKLVLETAYGMKIVFKGEFTVSGGVLTGGTVTSFTAFAGPTKVLKGSGYDLDAVSLVDAVAAWQAFDDQPLSELLLELPTKYIGSAQDDFLYGEGFGTKLLGKDGNDTVIGGDADQILKGGKGDDFLFAHDGFSFMYGGKGHDVFAFDEPGKPNKIKDFDPDKDQIGLDGWGFDAIGPGFLTDDQFRVGKQAKTESQIIIYDKKTGALYYDGDGSGTDAQIQFAKVAKGLDISAGNFFGELYGHMSG